MAAGFFKRNEKVLMTLLLLVLAPAFAFTGIMTWYLTQGRYEGKAKYEIGGRKYSWAEIDEIRDELSDQVRVNAARSFGPFFDRRRALATEGGTLEYILQREEVDQLGLRLAEGQQQEALREAALDVLTWFRVNEDREWLGTFQEVSAAFQAERPNARFNPDEYVRAVNSDEMKLSMSVERFERAVRASARLMQLSEIVGELAVATEKEMYDEYVESRQKRGFDYVAVSSDRFLEDARAQVDEAFLRDLYDSAPAQYRKPAAFQLQVAKAIRSSFIDNDWEPTIEEVQARYEQDKATRYRIARPADWTPPEGHTPEDDFRDITEVFESVVNSLRTDRAAEVEREVLQAGIEKAEELRATGDEWALEDAFPEEVREKIQFDTVDWFERTDLNAIPFDYRNGAVLGGLFIDPNPARVGEVGTEVVAVRTGDYIYKISGVEEPRAMTFEEAHPDITEKAEREKAKELTAEFLEGWVERIRTEEETTLQTFAEEENYTVRSSENPLGRFEGYLLRIDGQQVRGGSALVQQLFADCDGPGDITEPVISPVDDSVYVAALTEIAPPEMDQWVVTRTALENQVLSRRRNAIFSRFQTGLEIRAQVTPLYEVEEEVPAGG